MNKNKAMAHPYIAFNGNCREAMNFYKEALGGKLEIMNFEDTPEDYPYKAPAGYEKKVMHSELRLGDLVIMASDCPPDHPFNDKGNVSIMISNNDLESAKCMFEKLSAGGVVHMPFEKTFWAAGFAAFADKYGINWSVNCEC